MILQALFIETVQKFGLTDKLTAPANTLSKPSGTLIKIKNTAQLFRKMRANPAVSPQS